MLSEITYIHVCVRVCDTMKIKWVEYRLGLDEKKMHYCMRSKIISRVGKKRAVFFWGRGSYEQRWISRVLP